MSLDDILNSASRHRIEAVINNGARALDDVAERSRQLDTKWAETRARQETELKALEEKMKDAREANKTKQAEESGKRVAPKVKSLSLGGEEFREARQVAAPVQRPPQQQPPQPLAPPRPVEPVVEEASRGARPARTMRLGAPEESDERVEEPKPKPPERPRRPKPRNDTDDDLSGRTWLR